MPRILHSLIALAALASVLGLSGCVTIIGQTEAQTDTIGAVHISTTICVSRDPNAQGATCPDTNSNTGIDAGYADGQVLVAYRVPAAALAPDTIDMAYTSGDIGSLTLSRNESYSDQMNAKAPAVAGETWVGYLSPNIPANRQTADAQAEIDAVFGLARGSDGSPFRGPFSYRAVVGGRGTAGVPGRPVVCGADVTGIDDQMDGSVCVDTPTGGESAIADDDRAVGTKDLGVMNGAAASAAPGTAATMPFTIRAAGLNGSPSFNLAATTSVLGGSAIGGQTTFSPQAADATVPVTLNVPAGTAPGTYDVTLSAVLGSQTRTGHGTLTVTSPSTGAGTSAGAKPKVSLSIRHQKLGRAFSHGLRVRTGCDRPCAVRVKLGRYGSGRAQLAAPGSKVLTARFAKRWHHALRSRKSLRLTVTATASAGGQSSAKTLKLTLRR